MMRYGSNYSTVMDMDYIDGVQLIDKAFSKRNEDRLWQLYTVLYPNFSEENFMNFDKFKASIYKTPTTSSSIISVKSDEEIIDDAQSILEML